VISGFRREGDENRALLGYYGTNSGNFVTESPIFRFEPEDETDRLSRNVGNKLPLVYV